MLEALTEMGEDDIQEAREILRLSGKDPDVIIRMGMEKLGRIQHQVRSEFSGKQKIEKIKTVINPGFQIIDLKPQSREVVLSDDLQPQSTLTAQEVFDLFVRKTGPRGISIADVSFSDEASRLKISKHSWTFRFTINMQADAADVSIQVGKEGHFIEIPFDVLSIISQTGYLVHAGWWRPVENEALDFAREIMGKMSEPARLPLKAALEYFSQRHHNPYITFEPEAPDFGQIFSSDSYSSVSSLFIRSLYEYQEDGLKWLQYCCLNQTGGLLGDDMGLGKTAQTIALIAWLIEKDILSNILVVVPSTLLENWRREFQTFAPSIVPYIHHGNDRSGSTRLLASQKVVLTSYSMIINDMYLFNKITWGLVLLDEASLIRNPDSERRNALRQIPATVRIAMTGTPIENSLLDLWSIIDFIQPDYLGSRTDFLERYHHRDIKKSIDSSNLQQLKTDISYIMLRRKKEDVLKSLPEKIDIHQALTMKAGEARLYEDQRLSVLDGKQQEPGTFLKLIQDLRQLTTHPVLLQKDRLPDIGIEELRSASTKFDRTCELLDEIQDRNEKVLIFTEYLNMIDLMRNIFQQKYNIPVFTIDGRVDTAMRQENIDAFSARDGFGLMVLNPRTAGMGLNITAANHVIHYTRQWNPALEVQASARAYRNGQKKGVNIYYLYYTDTIEEVIDERLRLKTELSSEIITESDTESGMDHYLNAITKSPLNK